MGQQDVFIQDVAVAERFQLLPGSRGQRAILPGTGAAPQTGNTPLEGAPAAYTGSPELIFFNLFQIRPGPGKRGVDVYAAAEEAVKLGGE